MSADRPAGAPPETAHTSHRRGISERAVEKGRTDDLPSYPDTDNNAYSGMGPERGSTSGPPRWVAVVVIVIAALVLLGFVLLHLSGGLGPGLHGGG
jgi:hypothetical protein